MVSRGPRDLPLITDNEYVILTALRESPTPLHASLLQEISTGNVHTIAPKMATKGYVERHDSESLYWVYYSITGAGERILAAYEQAIEVWKGGAACTS